ncbi:LysR family transcriptional regulator [Variovorax sp. J22R133]|uniref:LysR family transcriptional regulator n=1 Tax=Variovorax brevis TaxID=3053503 RepID=UPI002578BECA|nr:LysR family transcriptional regulator [Variovorax sp. J22R133]MDM0114934.1 LysR family transcriptional regulator [Variovorax sp. J22R133]
MPSRALQETSLRYFSEVARTGSIQAASQRLHVAGSAISRQIANLEQALDVSLFDRRRRGMELTAAGELLMVHARRMALDTERVVFEIERLRGARRGLIRLCGVEGFATDFLPRTVAQFQRENPDVMVDLQMALPAEVTQRVREGDADIGMSFSRIAEKGIEVVHRQAAPVMALMRSGHPLAGSRRVTLRRLQEFPLALPSSDTTLRQLIELASSAAKLDIAPALTSNSAQALCAFVLEGVGITFCAEVSARPFVAKGEAVLIPISDRVMTERHLEIQTMAGRTLPDFMAGLVERMKTRLASAPQEDAEAI